jgi:DNA-binding beta-propeller fold protein YncE
MFFGLLAVLTARAAFFASFVRYDSAEEYLVYAHSARGVKTVMQQVQDISERTSDGLGLKVAYDADVSWPMTWYLRNYRNQAYFGENPTREALDAPVVIAGPRTWGRVESLLGDSYYKFEYIRMVWPMQEYFGLTWERIRYALTDPGYRQALWDIWYARDYTRYGELTSQSYALSQWPVADRMRFYVRKDVAGEIWSYGVGPTSLGGAEVVADPYVDGRQLLAALNLWGGPGAGDGQFDSPRGVAVAPDGAVYVADSRNHRIQKFNAQGEWLLSFGSFGSLEQGSADPGKFNEPWGVAVGPDGSVYVADTWNHRIQKFDANGVFLRSWGHFGQPDTLDGFWGPRGVAVDSAGRVYVADTGNKRIVVFDSEGNGIASIGAGGFEPGYLDEPVGLAVTDDGTVFVADTWNQRVQAFQPDASTGEYRYLRAWSIAGWKSQSLDNKPYLAVGPGNRLYVADPEGYRVLAFDTNGQFLTTWGDYGTDSMAFALIAGVAVDRQGNVYVVDAGSNRIMVFAPPLVP